MSVKRGFTAIEGYLFSGFVASKLRWLTSIKILLCGSSHHLRLKVVKIHTMSLRANKIINIRWESGSENFLMLYHKWEHRLEAFPNCIGFLRAGVGSYWVCTVWWPTGLFEEESRTERHVFQRPGYEATDQPYSRTVNEIRLAGRRWNGLLILKKGLL